MGGTWREREILLINAWRFAYAILKMETKKMFLSINYNSGAFILIKQKKTCQTKYLCKIK